MNKRILLAIVSLLALVNQVSAEDKVTIKDFSITPGKTKALNIELESNVTYAAFQFDLYLPQGITITEYSADNSRIPESTSLEMVQQENGCYRFIAAAMEEKTIEGNSGSIITIKVSASKDLESGSLTGYFRNIKLSKVGGTGVSYAEMSFPITVKEPPMKGDANGDGIVNATDIVEIVNFIMGHPSDKFNEDAADANEDGVVNAADMVVIVNHCIYLGRKKVNNLSPRPYSII